MLIGDQSRERGVRVPEPLILPPLGEDRTVSALEMAMVSAGLDLLHSQNG